LEKISRAKFEVTLLPTLIRFRSGGHDDRYSHQHGIRDVSLADGKQIAALMPVETAEAQNAQSHVIFLENFFDELRRKVRLSK
jgi:hypothetical protein